MTLILLTTTTLSDRRRESLLRLIECVHKFASLNSDVKIRHIILLQNVEKNMLHDILSLKLPFVEIFTEKGTASVSTARNKMLSILFDENTIKENDIVSFPDDDCWYPTGFLPYIVERYKCDPTLDFWLCRDDPSPVEASRSAEVKAAASDAVRRSNANTMFFRGRLILAVGKFDEEFGLGPGIKYKGGEDTDFGIRAFRLARNSIYNQMPAVGHPKRGKHYPRRYFPGAFMAISRHSHITPALQFEFLRKIGVGVYLTVTGALSAREFVSALRNGMRLRYGVRPVE